MAAPVPIYLNTFGTGIITDENIQTAVLEVFDFTPSVIIRELEIRKALNITVNA